MPGDCKGILVIKSGSVQGISSVALRRSLSESRLNAYREGPGESLQIVFARYRWNAALCTSLYEPLKLLEVVFRTRIHRELSVVHGTDAWYDINAPFLSQREQEAVRRAKSESPNSDMAPSALIAELNFGFWTSLLNRFYEPSIWPSLLKPMFPHMPRRERTRAVVCARINQIRHLRNMVFHYRAIWKTTRILQQSKNILDTIYWMEPELAGVPSVSDCFEDVFARGLAYYEVVVQ